MESSGPILTNSQERYKMIIIRQKQYSYYSDGPEKIRIENLGLRKSTPSFLGRLICKLIKTAKENQENSLFYDIYEGNKRIGEIETFRKTRDEINIVWIGIDKKHQGQGYAQKILKYFIDYSRKLGFKYMTLEVPEISPEARHIYDKLGFFETGVLTGSDDIVWGGLTEMKLEL